MAFRLGGTADAFADRNFRVYSVGSIVSWLSFFVQFVAVSWTAWDLTHSTQWLAIVALADAVPNICLMPIGGVIADRMDRFRLLLVAYAVATLQAALLAGFPPGEEHKAGERCHAVINAATGEVVLGHATEAEFDHWYDHHTFWRAPRDLAEVKPELRSAFSAAASSTHYLIND